MQITIAGGGVSGAYLALLLARKGFDVVVYDPQKEYKKACGDSTPKESPSGALAEKLGAILNYINCFDIYVNGVNIKHLSFRKSLWIIMDKWSLVNKLRELSVTEGAKYVYKSLRSLEAVKGIVVDARGPFSFKDYILAYRVVIKAKWPEDRVLIDFRPKERGLYWAFPRGRGYINIGGGFMNIDPKRLRDFVLSYAKKIVGDVNVYIVDERGAPIALNRRISLGFSHVLRVGEAAGLINSTSGEGIRHAIISSNVLATAVMKCYEDVSCIMRTYKSNIRDLIREVKISRSLFEVASLRVRNLADLFRSLPEVFWKKYLEGRLGLFSLMRSVLRPKVIKSLGIKGLLSSLNLKLIQEP